MERRGSTPHRRLVPRRLVSHRGLSRRLLVHRGLSAKLESWELRENWDPETHPLLFFALAIWICEELGVRKPLFLGDSIAERRGAATLKSRSIVAGARGSSAFLKLF